MVQLEGAQKVNLWSKVFARMQEFNYSGFDSMLQAAYNVGRDDGYDIGLKRGREVWVGESTKEGDGGSTRG